MIVHIRITLFFQFSCSNSDEGTKSQDQLSYGTSVGRLGVSRGGGVSSVGRGVGLRLVGLVLLVGEGLVATGSRGGSTWGEGGGGEGRGSGRSEGGEGRGEWGSQMTLNTELALSLQLTQTNWEALRYTGQINYCA